jgi:hypothetical protein
MGPSQREKVLDLPVKHPLMGGQYDHEPETGQIRTLGIQTPGMPLFCL